MHILLVEDEPDMAAVVAEGLAEAGHKVEVAHDGEAGLKLALSGKFALLILDVMLPGLSGWEVCQRLRAQRILTPILMLTARDAVSDRVHGLELGADDYLPKPFDFSELLARVAALLRRERMHKTRVIQIADLTLDTQARRVVRGGREIALTPREYTLLEALAGHEGQTLSRDRILDQIWQDEESLSNTVDVYIRFLRRKIDDGSPIKLIQTVHGVGYVLRAPGPEATG